MISERQLEIVKILYSQPGYITYGEIAKKLNMSVKTIRNDVTEIKACFLKQGIGEIITKPHEGIKLNMSKDEWEKFSMNFSNKNLSKADDDSEFYALYLLLTKGTVSYQELEEKLYMGRPAIERMLEDVNNWLDRFDMKLEKQKGKGSFIVCTEYQWRMAMWGFYQQYKEHFVEKDILYSVRTLISHKDYSAIVMVLKGFDISSIIDIMHDIERELQLKFWYDGILRAVFFLSLSVLRMQNRKYISMPQLDKCKTDSEYNLILTEKIVKRIEKDYQITIPQSEAEWIKMVVGITEIQEFTSKSSRRNFEIAHNELCRLTMKIIVLTSNITNINLRKDIYLAEHLFLELRVMIERLKYKINFKNPLLKQIKRKYPVIYGAAWSISVLIDKELCLEMNEDEIGYLAIYLGGAMERNLLSLKTCIVCNYGMGVSDLLKDKIQRTFNDIEIADIVTDRDIRRIDTIDCDFVISTMPLTDCKKECVVVEHLLLPYDINNIETTMRRVRKKIISEKNKKPLVSLTKNLFRKELIFLNIEFDNKEDLLRMMCRKMEVMGYVTEDFENSVLEREKASSTEVGNLIAIPHGYSRYVIHSIISVALLKNPIKWFDSDKVDLVFLLAFNIGEPYSMQNEIVNFYKAFSVFSEDDESLYKAKHCTTAEEMEQLFNKM